MKKTLLLAMMATAASLSFAATKTVTFDFSDPAKYGYEKPEKNAGTVINYGATIVSDGVTITNVFEGSTATTFRFFATNTDDATVTLRLAKDGVFTVNAGGATISKIEMTGNNLTTANLEITPGSFEDKTWTGSAETVTFSRKNTTLQFATMAVTFETGGSGPSVVKETYKAIEDGKIANVFENAVADGGRSIVSFGTDNMSVEAVGGRTPKDVVLTKEESFTDWLEWNEPEWKGGNTNLHDNKPGVDTVLFYYIQGTGNPAVEIGVDEPVEKDDNIVYKPKYTFYEPDGSLGMPVMGLYYKFMPKVSGSVKVQVWANKGNRYTYVVKESTMKPITYTKEGYVNGQNRTLENVTMKSLVNGADSIGTMNEKILFNNAQLDSIHEAVLWKYTYVNAAGETTKELTAANIADSIKAGVITTSTPLDTIKQHGVNDPYIIAGGNQAFWGWITFEVEAGEKYWLFQHSSQVGFGNYEFTFVADPAGIEEIASAKESSSNQTFDLSGRRVSTSESGKFLIKNGKKIIIR